MIEFELSLAELNELRETVPNFDVILEALKSNPLVKIIIDDGGWADCFVTSL